ncbi:hypothetical protein GLOIN_2v1790829 [Rhizophagus irregularis DAOM 181602=DAOM 197198]|nr:hypothetical protein GLOIN_2v1790829 [Rhizophagus irregularis DAOM 181602=DAOM 197198]
MRRTPSTFSTWHINQQCEYLHSRILKAANASLPSVIVAVFCIRYVYCEKYPSTYYNRYERTWSSHFIRLQNILHLYKKVIPSPPTLPVSLSICRQDDFKFLLDSLKFISSALYGLLLLKEKDFQDLSIRAKLDDRDNNFETDISSLLIPLFQELDVVLPWIIPFQLFLKNGLLLITLWTMWILQFYNSLLDPPTLEEWLSTVSSMPNDKAPGPSMITYEMLKHLEKSLVKLFYNRLASILASNEVLKGGNFAGLPGGSCRDPIVVLESIIHDAHVNKSPLWILSQDISKAFRLG